jgi:flagellar assembly protein FliH
MFKAMSAGGSAGFSADPRFAAILAMPEREPEPLPIVADPLQEAFDHGFAEGHAAALQAADAAEREREAARGAIELSLARLDQQTVQDMAERLRQTVLVLCEQAVMPLAIDPEGLALRVTRAVAMLQRAQDEKRVALHPDDLALVAARLPADLQVDADPRLERGALRIDTADGGIEDGPGQWRRILTEALRAC